MDVKFEPIDVSDDRQLHVADLSTSSCGNEYIVVRRFCMN